MPKRQDKPEGAAARRSNWGAAIVCLLAFLVVLGVYAYYLERRLDAFEQTLRPSTPNELLPDEPGRGDSNHLAANPVQGQVVYVPAYSHIYHGDGDPYLLTITLSVRNTSLNSEIIVKSVRYFNTKGEQVESYLDTPVRLPALGTTEVVVARDDASGGSGANFLVEWYSELPVSQPIIESVMIDTKAQQGLSFARRGTVITETTTRPAAADADGPTE
ncbi:hypothetical protein Pla175_30690 [Pirellulimonas nuda]|uniref:DUF3124 domain-containing protein n=1 Tax=Pirellulimonas nuda TaxID=2528009 RepID=A0A518DDW8_9BACT|nr:DUF3124 domain-containing protein [Pirellulimonas nuda]QDU89675.1 hypothetical protein Pla175_30690 [Pirellulimonas nuda]